MTEAQIIARYTRMTNAAYARFEKFRDAAQPEFDKAESVWKVEMQAADDWLDSAMAGESV